jgi:hypothetical protein
MNFLVSLIITTTIGFTSSTSGEQINSTRSCFDAISRLAAHDKILGSRSTNKRNVAPTTGSADKFKEKMDQIKANGTAFNCGETMSWVTEIFEGLGSQYEEYKNGRSGKKAGYKSNIGKDLILLFNTLKSSKNRIIYHCQHIGSSDHVFAIEQIPPSNGKIDPTYRIYQSYNGAFSLRAWLSKNLTADKIVVNGDIIIPHVSRCIQQTNDKSEECVGFRKMVDQMRGLFAGKGSAYDKFVDLNEHFSILNATAMFTQAWSLYGKGRAFSADYFFNEYLEKTAKVSKYYEEFSRTDTPWSADIYNKWIELYGSPDPMRYPGLPANLTAPNFNEIDYPSGYAFEVRAVALSTDEADTDKQCMKNANVLFKSFE